jgi:hypothetical protein
MIPELAQGCFKNSEPSEPSRIGLSDHFADVVGLLDTRELVTPSWQSDPIHIQGSLALVGQIECFRCAGAQAYRKVDC